MASSLPPFGQYRRKPLGFFANAMKRKDSFIQWIAMSGILFLSFRSLGQKYRLHHLEEDLSVLKQEEQNLTSRMSNIKRELLNEASLDSSGLFAARLRNLFGDDK